MRARREASAAASSVVGLRAIAAAPRAHAELCRPARRNMPPSPLAVAVAFAVAVTAAVAFCRRRFHRHGHRARATFSGDTSLLRDASAIDRADRWQAR